MTNETSKEVLLFTKCINLNTDHCRYTKRPEKVLSLFSDPYNCPRDTQKIQELNDICTGCEWHQSTKPQP